MTLFGKIFGIFRRYRKSAVEFHKAYEDLHELAKKLAEALPKLREYQEQLVAQLEDRRERFAGHAGLSKTLVINEALVPGLQALQIQAEKRYKKTKWDYEKAEKDFEKITKPLADEALEIEGVRKLLKEIEGLLVDIEKIKKLPTTKEKLDEVQNCLKEISNVLKEFYHRKKYGMEKKVLEDWNKIKLIKNVYDESKIFYFCPKDHKIDQENPPKQCPVCKKKVEGLWEYEFENDNQLLEFQKQANHLNSHNDKKNRVIWRRWWRDRQQLEEDFGTGYTKKHLNAWVQLRGSGKKNIHLLVA